MRPNNRLKLSSWIVLISVLSSAVPAIGEAVLPCPDTTAGLCMWNGHAWENFWSYSSPEELVDYEEMGGFVVLLLRGHMDSGRVAVLNRHGEVVLTRDLATGRGLYEVTGMTEDGLLALCNGTIGMALCDTWLRPKPSRQLPFPPVLPDGCVFPRFLEDTFACIREWPEPAIISEREGQRKIVMLAFDEARWSQNFHVLSTNRFFIEAGDAAFISKEDELHRLSNDEVLWSRRTDDDHVAFAQCRRGSMQELRDCSIIRTGADIEPEEIWRSETSVPTRFIVLGDGKYLVDLMTAGQRSLILLRREATGFEQNELWRQEAASASPRGSTATAASASSASGGPTRPRSPARCPFARWLTP